MKDLKINGLEKIVQLRRGGRGTSILTQLHTGGCNPRSTPYLFIYHFWRKKYPFRILVIEKCYPLHLLLWNGA